MSMKNIETSSGLAELYQLGEAIAKLKQDELDAEKGGYSSLGPYRLIEFTTKRCGTPAVYGNLVIPIETYTTKLQVDSEVAGTVLSSSVFVRCRPTGTSDLDGFPVYEGYNGTVFVYKYSPPTLIDKIDRAMFACPRLQINQYIDLSTAFENTAKAVVAEVFPGTDILQEMVAINRFRDLQLVAYVQGLMTNEENEKTVESKK